ncbi:hypothetical protein NSS79_12875 [Paenibacillus sp. FSL L8-0436]|uniref:hypothetical protein n=1 Tax=Paenibacillus sp. FSL L8-0436 TaxID=2954686 RepID=UPI0031581B60
MKDAVNDVPGCVQGEHIYDSINSTVEIDLGFIIISKVHRKGLNDKLLGIDLK